MFDFDVEKFVKDVFVFLWFIQPSYRISFIRQFLILLLGR